MPVSEIWEAVREGDLDRLKYCHENDCPWDDLTCVVAAKNGNLDCIMYAHERGCPWSSSSTPRGLKYLNARKTAATEVSRACRNWISGRRADVKPVDFRSSHKNEKSAPAESTGVRQMFKPSESSMSCLAHPSCVTPPSCLAHPSCVTPPSSPTQSILWIERFSRAIQTDDGVGDAEAINVVGDASTG